MKQPMTEELHPGQTFGGYRVEGVAGRGGMGIVYRATQIALGRTVALKLITPVVATDAAFRERLQRESHLLASVDHPNVITVYEAGEAEGQLFMSMRYVDGMDLRSLLVAQGPLPPMTAVRIVAQVAGALDAAHATGLVHRDVKPANVLLEQHGATHRAYLSDFGLTKRANLATAITGSGQWVGTLDYTAPEQIDGRPVDARTDVYSLGCVLFESLTARAPYVRESDAAKLWAHMREAPPSARDVRPELPDELDHVIARAMAKDPEHRYQSAGALGHAALAAAGGEALTDPALSVPASAEAATAAAESTTAAADNDAETTRTSMGGAPQLDQPVVARRHRPLLRDRRHAMPAGILVMIMAFGTLLVTWAPWNSQGAETASTAPPTTAPRGQEGTLALCSDRRDNDGNGKTDYPQDRGCSSAADDTEAPQSSKQRSPSASSDRSESSATDGTEPRESSARRSRSPSDTSAGRDSQCSDRRDNDSDGKTDYPQDSGCSSRTDGSEKHSASSPTPPPATPPPSDSPPPPPATPPPADPAPPPGTSDPPPAATSPAPATRLAACKNDLDDDEDGKTDYPADPDCTSPTDKAEKVAACADDKDNDEDGKTDFPADPQCTSADDTAEAL